MKQQMQVLALVSLASLGLVAGAYGASASPRWHWPTTTTRPVQTTTTAETVTATTAATVTATTVTATPTAAPADVTITSPLNYTATLKYKTEILAAGVVDPNPGLACVFDFGDGTAWTVAPTPQANGSYACATAHSWSSSGTYVVRVSAVDASGTAASASIYLYVV
jgi:hypothetical protein